jgi:hypothetical protein
MVCSVFFDGHAELALFVRQNRVGAF